MGGLFHVPGTGGGGPALFFTLLFAIPEAPNGLNVNGEQVEVAFGPELYALLKYITDR